jgi:crotonobetainyl-CoA:carnitine CoA-transferase CaiB-like acyl-CoA transferase
MEMTNDNSNATGPLKGLRVLDFTALLQGPLATQILADMGADVVKFEKEDGEWMRHWGIFMAHTHGETDAFLAFNRNKRSVAVDLRADEDRERLLALARKADVVVENFRPGVMDKLGLGYDALQKLNPDIIYAASSGFGRTGPYAKRPGQDYLVQAITGAMWLTGRRDDPPLLFGAAVADQFTGVHLALGILAALQHRHRTGEGQRIDVDLLSGMMAIQQQELTVFLNHGKRMERPAENVGHPGITAPCGVYPTSDGYFLLAMTSCPKLGEILAVDWLDEYVSNESIFAARDEVHRRLSRHFVTGTTAHWVELLGGHDIWCAPVKRYEDLEQDPQVAHKNLIWDVPYADSDKTYRTVGSPFTFSASPVGVHRSAPRTGQHTGEFRNGEIWND